MYKNICVSLIVVALALGCNEEANQGLPTSSNDGNVEQSFKRAFSDGDYNFQVEYNNRLDTSYLDVLYKGKKVKRFGFKGKVKNEILADLNFDKENELYIETDYEGKINMHAYHFDQGNAIEIIKQSYGDKVNTIPISYKIVRDQLLEEYHLPLESGKNENRISKYNLVRKGNDLVLLPQGWHPKAIENMSGQYAERDAVGAGYYKVMILKNKEEGVWNVDIKVKRNGDKKIICDFNGDGFFLDENLIVPFNKINPELEGALKITFLEMWTAVYTVDRSDNKELIAFCNGVGSIAGNFKKTSI